MAIDNVVSKLSDKEYIQALEAHIEKQDREIEKLRLDVNQLLRGR